MSTTSLESQLPMLRRRERLSFWWAAAFIAVGLIGLGLQVVSYFVVERAASSVGPANQTPEQMAQAVAEAMGPGIAVSLGGMFFIVVGGVGLLISLLCWLVTMRRRRQMEGQLQAKAAAQGGRV